MKTHMTVSEDLKSQFQVDDINFCQNAFVTFANIHEMTFAKWRNELSNAKKCCSINCIQSDDVLSSPAIVALRQEFSTIIKIKVSKN